MCYQGRNEQVRKVRLADGRRLRGRIFPEFTDFIPKNLEYLPQISVRSTRKNFWGHKKLQGWGAKMALRSAKLTFGGGKKLEVQKLQGGNEPIRKKKKWRPLMMPFIQILHIFIKFKKCYVNRKNETLQL